MSLNLHRRHLDESQRAIVAAKIANLGDGQRKSASPIGERAVTQGEAAETASIEAVSQPRAAELLNVSRAAVQRAVKVKNEGAPELVQAVESGKVSVSAAADVAELPKEEQTEIVARGEREILQAAKRIREQRVEENRERRAAEKAAAVAIPPTQPEAAALLNVSRAGVQRAREVLDHGGL